MTVLDVEHRIVAGLGRPQPEVDVQRRIHGRTDQGIAGCIDANCLHQILEGDHSTGALGHLLGFAVFQQVNHLTDHDFDLVGVVPQCRSCCLQAGNVTVVVGPQHVDAQVVAAFDFVDHVGNVAGDVRGVAIRLNDDAILVVSKFRGA